MRSADRLRRRATAVCDGTPGLEPESFSSQAKPLEFATGGIRSAKVVVGAREFDGRACVEGGRRGGMASPWLAC